MAAAAGAAATIAVTATGAPAVASQDRAAIERIVRDYILANPEILPEAMDRLAAKESGKAVAANRAAIETPFRGAWEGAADADVTLVQFFDYQCGYCRASLPDIDRLLREDARLRIVYRELPVLGPASDAAAAISLKVAGDRTRYAKFHRAVYAAGRLDDRTLARLGSEFGAPPTGAPDPAITEELASNRRLQNALRLTGTPSWVVGDQLLAGAVGYDAIKAAIAEQRAKRR